MISLAKVFAIDVCTYAVMSNHYHVVLHVDREQAESWEDRVVIERWHQLFSAHPFSHRFLAGDTLLKVEQKVVSELIPCGASDSSERAYFLPETRMFVMQTGG